MEAIDPKDIICIEEIPPSGPEWDLYQEALRLCREDIARAEARLAELFPETRATMTSIFDRERCHRIKMEIANKWTPILTDLLKAVPVKGFLVTTKKSDGSET